MCQQSKETTHPGQVAIVVPTPNKPKARPTISSGKESSKIQCNAVCSFITTVKSHLRQAFLSVGARSEKFVKRSIDECTTAGYKQKIVSIKYGRHVRVQFNFNDMERHLHQTFREMLSPLSRRSKGTVRLQELP